MATVPPVVGSPTRSAAQTGRNPIHVNVQNLDPNNYNPRDPVSGMSAVPRNMTGVAEVMKRAGYVTAFCKSLCIYYGRLHLLVASVAVPTSIDL